jgi:hypothetical protein
MAIWFLKIIKMEQVNYLLNNRYHELIKRPMPKTLYSDPPLFVTQAQCMNYTIEKDIIWSMSIRMHWLLFYIITSTTVIKVFGFIEKNIRNK